MTELSIIQNRAGNGGLWLKQGFQYFRANPFSWMGAMLLYLAISTCISIVPVLGGLINPFVSAFMLGGLMLGCQAQSQGQPFTAGFLFGAFSRKHMALARLALIYLGFVLIAFIPFFIFALSIGLDIFSTTEMENISADHVPMFLLAILTGAALAIPAAMGYWLAPALIVSRGMDAWPAFVLSFRGCLKNIVPALVYGLILLFWGILASIPVLLGWLVLLPSMTAATFAAYQNIFKSDNNLV